MPEQQRVAVVTGAGRGIGRSIAERLSGQGYRLLVTDVDGEAAGRTAGLLGAGAVGLAQDVRDPDGHREVAARAAELGRPALWVNNAGVLHAGPAWSHPDDEVERLLAVNVGGVVAGCRAAVDALRGGGGTILNIASISALTPVPGLALYAASKAAVLSYSTSLQADLRQARIPIRVRALCPDVAATAMVTDRSADPGAAILFSGPAPLRPEAVAEAAVALIGSRQVFRVLPRWRGVMSRAGGTLPATAIPLLGLMQRLGARRQSRLGH